MNQEKVLIWKGLWTADYVTVKTCLELNGIEVEMRNELAATVLNLDGAATGGAHLWIYKSEYPAAVELLYDNGYLSQTEYLEAKGISRIPDNDEKQERMRITWVLVGIISLVLTLIVVLAMLMG